jgi:hypothetical protein
MLKSIGKVIEKQLAKAAKELKSEVYRIGGQIPAFPGGEEFES